MDTGGVRHNILGRTSLDIHEGIEKGVQFVVSLREGSHCLHCIEDIHCTGGCSGRAIEGHGIFGKDLAELLKDTGIDMGVGRSSGWVKILSILMCNALVIGAGRDQTEGVCIPFKWLSSAKHW